MASHTYQFHCDFPRNATYSSSSRDTIIYFPTTPNSNLYKSSTFLAGENLYGENESWALNLDLNSTRAFMTFELKRYPDAHEKLTVRLDHVEVQADKSSEISYISPFTLRNEGPSCWRASVRIPDIYNVILESNNFFTFRGRLLISKFQVSAPPPVRSNASERGVKRTKNQLQNSSLTRSVNELQNSSLTRSVNELQNSSLTRSVDTKTQTYLVQDMGKMYKSSSCWDVKFRLGSEELKAHKCVLVSRSPVFQSMFEQDAEENSNEILIEDFDLHTFNCFLMALYTGQIEDHNLKTVLAIYRAATKYQVSWLQKMCSELLSANLTSANVCCVLVQSDLLKDTQLKEKAKNCFLGCFKEVSHTEEWMDVIKNIPVLANEILMFVSSSMAL